MVEKNPQTNFDVDNIPYYLSYEAMKAKYNFNLADKNRFLGKGSFGQVHLFENKNEQ